MLRMGTQASDVQLSWKQHRDADKLKFRQMQDQAIRQRQDDAGSISSSSQASERTFRYLMMELTSNETIIAAVSHILLDRSRPEPGPLEGDSSSTPAQ